MLDAYIIDRIRREREREKRDGAFVPLHIEVPRDERPQDPKPDADEGERGSTEIDFKL